ncbi:MAG: hypothetical protein JWO57_2784 [Pseudonocardiales bacterium]|nr:hypothetical protein [Pseudonocardiales bacterium]
MTPDPLSGGRYRNADFPPCSRQTHRPRLHYLIGEPPTPTAKGCEMWQQRRAQGRPFEPIEQGRVENDNEAIADIDREIVSARSRWLDAVWEEDVERVERAMLVVDALLERRLEIMQVVAGAPAA